MFLLQRFMLPGSLGGEATRPFLWVTCDTVGGEYISLLFSSPLWKGILTLI
jgi:hypothetical protein